VVLTIVKKTPHFRNKNAGNGRAVYIFGPLLALPQTADAVENVVSWMDGPSVSNAVKTTSPELSKV